MVTAGHQYKTNYDFNWALSVVFELREKYARATAFFCKMSGYDEYRLAGKLASWPEDWRFIRDSIVHFGYLMKMHPEHRFSSEDYYTYVEGEHKKLRTKLSDELFYDLTRYQISRMLEEQ